MFANLLIAIIAITLTVPLLVEMVGLMAATRRGAGRNEARNRHGFEGFLIRAFQAAAAVYIGLWLQSSMDLLDALLEDQSLPVEQIIQIQEQQASLISSSIYFLAAILVVPWIVRAARKKGPSCGAGPAVHHI